MSKSNFIVKSYNKFYKFINSLLENNLNKLNLNNLRNLTKNNIIIFTFVAFIILFISYLLLPTFYKQSEISAKLQNELNNKLKLNFKISDNINYNFFPRPHFKISKASILNGNYEISEIKNLKIYVSLENLFSLKSIEIKDVIVSDANFNLKKENYDFFIKILDNNFLERNLLIKNSKVFFKSNENEVLFINKILELNYSFDTNELKNIAYSENEIFNFPYTLELFHNKNKNEYFSKLNLSLAKLQIENVFKYGENPKTGSLQIISNKNKSTINFKTNKNFFEFIFFDKLENPRFTYNGIFNFNPFFSSIVGDSNSFNLSYLFETNSMIAQLLKTEILNSKNLDFKLNINANNIYDNLNFQKLNLNSKIYDGLIDLDNSSLNWKNIAEFNLNESLIYVNEGELVLDGKLRIKIKNYDELYKFLLTPKNYRKKIENVEFNFTYNFDKKIAYLKDIKVDDKFDQNLNLILNNVILKSDNLQNKIYFKNLLNKAIKKSYAG